MLGRIAAVVLAVALVCSGCDDDDSAGDTGSTSRSTVNQPQSDSTAGGNVAASPIPDEMCPNGRVPQAAAYDLDDGSFRWASCTDRNASRSVEAVTDDAVYVLDVPFPGVVALDPADGSVLTDAPRAPAPEVTFGSDRTYRVPVEGLIVTGGQDDDVTVYNADGTVRWTGTGGWAWDNVWAIDDGVVFAFDYDEPATAGMKFPARLIAYELASGEIRWDYLGDASREGLIPWRAEAGRVFTVGQNLEVRDTGTGELLWKTSYPPPQNPMWTIAGVDADDDTVYVGFATAYPND